MAAIPGTGPLVMDRSGLAKGSLDGEVAVVTGGGGNIGLGVARSLAWLGAKVVIPEVSADFGKPAAALINEENGPGTALFVETDVSDEASMKEMAAQAFDAFGKVDILVNNAMAMSLAGPILDSTVAQLDRQYEIAARGTFLGIRQFIPGMQARHHGVITYMTTSFCYPMGPSNYSAAKAAATSIIMSLAFELGPYEKTGISVFTFLPAGIGFPKSGRVPAPKPGETPKFKMPPMPGYEGSVPPEDGGAAFAYCVAHAPELHGSGVMVHQVLRHMDWAFPRPKTVRDTEFDRIDDTALALIFGYMGTGLPDPKVTLRPLERQTKTDPRS